MHSSAVNWCIYNQCMHEEAYINACDKCKICGNGERTTLQSGSASSLATSEQQPPHESQSRDCSDAGAEVKKIRQSWDDMRIQK